MPPRASPKPPRRRAALRVLQPCRQPRALPPRSQTARPSRAFSTTSARRGGSSTAPGPGRARVCPKLIACTRGWMSVVACGPMRCAPSSRPVVGSASSLQTLGGVLHRPAVCRVAVGLHEADVGDARARTHSCSVSPTVATCGWLKMPAGTWSCGRGQRSSGCTRLWAMARASRVGDVLELVGRADVAEGPDARRARAAAPRRRRPGRRRAARCRRAASPRSAVLGSRPVATSSRSPSSTELPDSSSRCRRTPSPCRATAVDRSCPVRTSHCVAGERGETVGDLVVEVAHEQRAAGARQLTRTPKDGEDVGHLDPDVAAPDDDEVLGQVVDAHDRVGGVERARPTRARRRGRPGGRRRR